MRTRALEMEVKHDFQAQRIVGQALQNGFQYDHAAKQQNARNGVDYAKEVASRQANLQNDSSKLSLLHERQFLTEALKTSIGKTNSDSVLNEYNSRAANGEFSNLIKNDFERHSSRASESKTSKSTDQWKTVEVSANEIKAAKEIDSLSMDDLEKAVRQKAIAEKEIIRSVELLIGI